MKRMEPESRSRMESKKEAKTESEPLMTRATNLKMVKMTFTPKLIHTIHFSCLFTIANIS